MNPMEEIKATITAAFIVPVNGQDKQTVDAAIKALDSLIADKELFEKRWCDLKDEVEVREAMDRGL